MQPDFLSTTITVGQGIAVVSAIGGSIVAAFGGFVWLSPSGKLSAKDLKVIKTSLLAATAGLALYPALYEIRSRVEQPIKDQAMEIIVQQANHNFAAVLGQPRDRTIELHPRYGDKIYDGTAKMEIATAQPAAGAPTHLCVRINSVSGRKIDATTKLERGRFGLNTVWHNEHCYSTGPSGKFYPNPRVKFGKLAPAL